MYFFFFRFAESKWVTNQLVIDSKKDHNCLEGKTLSDGLLFIHLFISASPPLLYL